MSAPCTVLSPHGGDGGQLKNTFYIVNQSTITLKFHEKVFTATSCDNTLIYDIFLNTGHDPLH